MILFARGELAGRGVLDCGACAKSSFALDLDSSADLDSALWIDSSAESKRGFLG